MPDFDSPVSIANEHTRAAMSDADRDRLAKGALGLLRGNGVLTTDAVKDIVYALANGLRVLGAINVGIADLGLELGALVRATALSGLATAHAASDEQFPAELIGDLGTIAEDDADDEGGDGGGTDAIAQAAALLDQLSDAGRHDLSVALATHDPLDAEAYAEVLDRDLDDDEDEER